MTRYDAIIFDIDGTLWNASPASAKGWNLGLAKLGIDREISVAEIEMVAGTPYEQCVDILLPGLKEKYSELLDTIEGFEIEVMKSEGGKFFDGVIEGINKLADVYMIFLVSNCQDWYLGLFLDFSGLKPMLTGFDCNGMSGLPKNEMLSRMKDRYSLKNPVYIGDTIHLDVEVIQKKDRGNDGLVVLLNTVFNQNHEEVMVCETILLMKKQLF